MVPNVGPSAGSATSTSFMAPGGPYSTGRGQMPHRPSRLSSCSSMAGSTQGSSGHRLPAECILSGPAASSAPQASMSGGTLSGGRPAQHQWRSGHASHASGRSSEGRGEGGVRAALLQQRGLRGSRNLRMMVLPEAGRPHVKKKAPVQDLVMSIDMDQEPHSC